MRAQKVIPTVAVEQIGGFTINGDVDGLIPLNVMPGLRIQLDDPDEAEIRPVADPHPAVGGIKQQSRIDRVAIFDAVRRGDDMVVIPEVVGRTGIERLAPLDANRAGVPAAQSAAGRRVGHVVTIAHMDQVGGRPGLHPRAAAPSPAVIGHQAGAAGAPRVILAIALQDRRGIMDVRFTVHSQCRPGQTERKQGGNRGCQNFGFHKKFWCKLLGVSVAGDFNVPG